MAAGSHTRPQGPEPEARRRHAENEPLCYVALGSRCLKRGRKTWNNGVFPPTPVCTAAATPVLTAHLDASSSTRRRLEKHAWSALTGPRAGSTI